jgi:hypothetical protein
MDGTASLANRDFGPHGTKRRKVLFSGAACRANEAAHGAISPIWAENPQRRDSLADDAVHSELVSGHKAEVAFNTAR